MTTRDDARSRRSFLKTAAGALRLIAGREPLTPGEEGLRDLRIMTAIYEAAHSGKTLRLA